MIVSGGGAVKVDALHVNTGYMAGSLSINGGGTVHADTIELVNGSTYGFSQDANTLLQANQLTGFDGGGDALEVFGGDLYLGYAGGATASSHTLDAGVTWQVDGYMAVGYDKASTLIVTDGAVDSDRVWVGREIGSDGSSVSLQGATASWNSSDVFVVGSKAAGSLEVVGGATLEALSGHAGYHATATSSVLVDGGGSSWTCPVFLTLGREGAATVDVSGGGLIQCGMGRLGLAETGAVTMTVTGAGSSLLCDDWLDVGGEGTAALTITDAATLTAPEVNIGHESTSSGTLALENQASATVTGAVYVGGDADAAGGGGMIGIGTDCLLSVGETILVWDGGNFQQTGGSVVADVFDLRCDGGATFTQGADGVLSVNVLTGFTGSQTFGGDLNLGQSTGASVSENTLELGTSWVLGGAVWIGYEKPATLAVNDAVISGNETRIGRDASTDGSTVTITGPEAAWVNSNTFQVGSEGDASLHISGGGSLGNYNGHVSYHELSDSSVTVTGDGSSWSNTTYLTIGRAGTATVLVEDGGAIDCAMGRLGWAETGEATMTVSGDGSSFTCDDWLDVGTSGTTLLTITDGGELLTPEINIGHESTADGTLTISDGGTCHVSGSVYIAGDADDGSGSTASLLITDDSAAGTDVVVDDTIVVYYPGSITLTGGLLTAQTIDTYYDGYKSFTGGVLHVETFIGNLENEGIVLAPGNSIGTTEVQDGAYIQSSGSLEIEIGSATAYDQLICHDSASLGGDLIVRIVDDYVPDSGDSFTIVTAGEQISGTFNNAATQVDVDGGGTFDITYNSDTIVLSNYDNPAPPDCLIVRPATFYFDGFVEAGDRFGAAVDLHGDVVLIGAPGIDFSGWGFEPPAGFSGSVPLTSAR